MKKLIFTVALLLSGTAAYSQNNSAKSNLEFQKYIAKNLSHSTSFAADGSEGTVRVRVKITPQGIEPINVISGVNSKIDDQVVAVIKKTPSRISSKMVLDSAITMVVPIRLVIE